MEFTSFGYEFLSPIMQNKKVRGFHPGVDLNFGKGNEDLGKYIYAMADGVVIHSRNTGSGWGNIVVIYHQKLGVWTRYAHFDKLFVRTNQVVKEGEEIGTCGNTGTQYAHLHFEVWKKELRTFTQYIYGWSKGKVMEYFADPLPYIEEVNKKSSIPDWSKEAVASALKAGLTGDNLTESVTARDIQIDLEKLKVIKEVNDLQRYRWYVILNKLKLL